MPCRASAVNTGPTKVCLNRSRCSSTRTKKNVLFLMMGPPNRAPNWLRFSQSFGAPLELLNQFVESSAELRLFQNTLPRNAFVPERVTICTWPEPRPNSASTVAEMTHTSSTRSGLAYVTQEAPHQTLP